MRINEFARYFDDVRWTGDSEFQTHCPCHVDKKASLSVGVGNDGKILLYCHANCTTQAILDKLGLSFSDISGDREKKPFQRKKVIAVYEYTNGTRKVRYEPKSFTWEHKSGNKWESGRGDAPHVLYQAGTPGDPVYLVEGEKDADNVGKNLGLYAVSPENGAGKGSKWLDQYTQELRGQNVVILPDNDDVGREFMQHVADELLSVAQSVKILDLSKVWSDIPEHGDISDLIDQVGSDTVKAMLKTLEAGTDYYTVSSEAEDVFSSFGFYSVPDLTEEERRPPDFIVDNMLPVGMTFLSGAPKTRKSFLALQLAIAVATGQKFFGYATTMCDVVYLDLEGSKSRLYLRTQRMTSAMPSNILVTNRVPARLSDGLTDMLRALHRQRPSIRLIIIDTYSRARGNPRAFGQNAYDADVQFLEPIQQMALEENIAIMFVHHDKKGAGFASDSFERLSGTMGISGSADAVMNLIAEGKRFDGKAKLEYTPRDAKGGELDLIFSENYLEWQTYEKPVSDIKGNPVCCWILENVPPPRIEGQFFSYQTVFKGAYNAYSDNPGDKVREQLNIFRTELFSDYNVAIQVGVKSHGERGIRVLSVA